MGGVAPDSVSRTSRPALAAVKLGHGAVALSRIVQRRGAVAVAGGDVSPFGEQQGRDR
jgi:hypothetical protein